MRGLALLLCGLLLPATLQAVEVFKCTDPSGRVSFGQQPCPSGSQTQFQDVKPINTVEPQAANPEDVRYLEESRKRSARERTQREKSATRTKKTGKKAKSEDDVEDTARKPTFKKPKPIKIRMPKLKSHGFKMK